MKTNLNRRTLLFFYEDKFSGTKRGYKGVGGGGHGGFWWREIKKIGGR